MAGLNLTLWSVCLLLETLLIAWELLKIVKLATNGKVLKANIHYATYHAIDDCMKSCIVYVGFKCVGGM